MQSTATRSGRSLSGWLTKVAISPSRVGTRNSHWLMGSPPRPRGRTPGSGGLGGWGSAAWPPGGAADQRVDRGREERGHGERGDEDEGDGEAQLVEERVA